MSQIINPWEEFNNPPEEEPFEREIVPERLPKQAENISPEDARKGVEPDPDYVYQHVNAEIFPRPDFNNKPPDDPSILILSPSLIRQVIDKHDQEIHVCPWMIYNTYITGKYSFAATSSMENGSFFETLALGSGRNGEMTIDLPRHKKTGAKNAPQRKIEAQVALFWQHCKERGLEIQPNFNTQIDIYKHYGKNIFLKGGLDIFPVVYNIKGVDYVGIVDLKLTGNVESTFGDYPWGAPEHMDHVQADVYLNLIRNIDFGLNDEFNPNNHLRQILDEQLIRIFDEGKGTFQYWVYGYACKEDPEILAKQHKHVTRELTNEKQADLTQRINRAVAILKRHKDTNWEPEPEQQRCFKCPLANFNGGECQEAIYGNVV